MISRRLPTLTLVAVLAGLCLLLTAPHMVLCAHGRAKADPGAVWIVFFASKDCSKCKSVKRLLRSLRGVYPIRTKSFDIGRKSHYRLFERLEAIHSENGFSVPLILIGDKILMGEDEITADLEATVGRLADAGGAPLPYLGPRYKERRLPRRATGPAKSAEASRCDCEKQGRPPTLGEEWSKIRTFLDKWL